jgi:Fe-S-cluster-containing dehydrogenase component/DMSO reductase anchor subunit
MLENGWEFSARRIFTRNPDALSHGPVVNVSMACNHCKDPVCLAGCPATAYHTDQDTGAVITDPLKCMGCRYCTWNCPYDAPKFNSISGIIEKCHFCNHLITAGDSPACCSACPTGALGFGEIPDNITFQENEIIPERGINPSSYFKETIKLNGPEIIPSIPEEKSFLIAGSPKGSVTGETSLIAFTFLSAISVSLAISGIFVYRPSWYWLSLVSILLAGLSSLFHLGSVLKAWRSLSNIRHSPLSREIFALILYCGMVVANPFMDYPIYHVMVSVSGLILLIVIDSVYSFTSGKINQFHSGQVFITSLLMVSFFTHQAVPFLFIAALKIIIIFRSGQLTGKDRTMFGPRFIRLALLVISAMILVSGTGKGESTPVLIFLTGELIDRYLFYYDFIPLNISRTINNQINIS